MSGDGKRDLNIDAADDDRDSVTDHTANHGHGEEAKKKREAWADCQVEAEEANDKTVDAQNRVDSEREGAKSVTPAETGDFSDKITDALNEAGEKFGGLIDKAKSVFGDNEKKR